MVYFFLPVISFKTDFFDYLIKCNFWLTFKSFFNLAVKEAFFLFIMK